MKQLVLASGSPARKEILEKIDYPFQVDVSNFEEDMTLKMAPEDLSKHLSLGKAKDVATRHKNAVVLAADSFAVFKDKLLGKPNTVENAKKMLSTLSGQGHFFITGFTVLDADTGKQHTDFVETKVFFRELSPDDINGYLRRENVLNNAGAYIIQGLGRLLVERIDGDYDNVMGLPISRIAPILKDFGIQLL